MSLSDDLAKVETNLEAQLAVLGETWDKQVAADQAAVETLVADTEKAQAALALKLQAKEAEYRKKADTDTQAIIDAADKLLLEANERDKAALLETSEKLSDEATWAAEMADMKAEDIAADYRKTEVVRVAKHLGLKSSGKEIEVTTRIAAHFVETATAV